MAEQMNMTLNIVNGHTAVQAPTLPSSRQTSVTPELQNNKLFQVDIG
jgi:hypothetical protein